MGALLHKHNNAQIIALPAVGNHHGFLRIKSLRRRINTAEREKRALGGIDAKSRRISPDVPVKSLSPSAKRRSEPFGIHSVMKIKHAIGITLYQGALAPADDLGGMA
jgi:hypothetical protein